MFYRPCHVHEISPGTHTFFPTYTCPVYCWRSVQLLDFSLYGNLIHASQPIRTTCTGQWFASGFLQTPPHGDALALGCTLPTAGRVRDFHPLERVPAGHTMKRARRRLAPSPSHVLYDYYPSIVIVFFVSTAFASFFGMLSLKIPSSNLALISS